MLAYVCPSRFAPGYNYGPGLLPGLCGPYLIEEHDQKRFKSLLHSLHISCDFSDALKIHLNDCRVCCPLNDQIRHQGCLEVVCQMAARAVVTIAMYIASYLFCNVSCPKVSNSYPLCSLGRKPVQNSRCTCLR